MIDLTGLSLTDLEALGPTSLHHALARIMRRAEDTSDPVLAFLASL
ncbi:FxSxx-COOH cyclophane-containing RiPP peptide [Sphaerisporangium sp. TRM90804]|nr:FxSxx-COOH cyclophane-containing RiPP peptide [Sphaerisporangium sp. TRM90804]MDH2427497.1 FxSxx-COOH protein [Sphaerisporangium sp. TRM90804]